MWNRIKGVFERGREVGTEQSNPFGLMAWLNATRVVLPLKGVECRFAVCGDLLDVELDQIFYQSNAQALDCVYTFPLPAGAVVFRCEMHVNGRIVRARVEEARRARELAREKKEAGFRTALVEMERDNLFTLSLGNVQPGDLVVIRLAYFQTLSRLADWTSFHIPFCPGLRYIPGKPLLRGPFGRGVVDDTDQVPDASRISPPRIDQLHPDAAYVSVEGRLEDSAGELRDISSPSHPVVVREEKGGFGVVLAERNTVPDRDLVVRWIEVPANEMSTRGWVGRDGNSSYALIRFKAPPLRDPKERTAQDVYFLLDRSGSMNGLKWEKSAQAFREFVRKLTPEDGVWLTLFESGYQDFAEKPIPATDVLRDQTVQQLEALGTGGGTEMLPALRHVIERMQTHSKDRSTTLLVITDGQVGNEAEILSELRKQPDLHVHTFGIDVAVNDGFLTTMASQQRGTSWWLSPNDDIVGAVARMADQLRPPVVTGLQVPEGWETAAARLVSIHAGEQVCLALRGPGGAMDVAISGTQRDGSTCLWSVQLARSSNPAFGLLWAKQRIDRLMDEGLRAEAIDLAKRSNIVCKGTSFIAWDEAEKVTVSQELLYQPSMETETAFGLTDLCCVTDGSRPTKARRHWLAKRIRSLDIAEHVQHEGFTGTPGYMPASMPFPLQRWSQMTSAMEGRAAAPFRGCVNSFISELARIVSALAFEEPFFNSDTGDDLLECLLEWFFCDLSPEECQLDPQSLLARRLEGLKWLIEELAVAGDNLAARFDCLRRWLGENLLADSVRLETAFRRLDEIQREKGPVPS